MYKKSLGMRHFRVFRARRRQSWSLSWAAEVARDGKDKKTAPMEAVGCTIDGGQEAKTEILGKTHGAWRRVADGSLAG